MLTRETGMHNFERASLWLLIRVGRKEKKKRTIGQECRTPGLGHQG